MKLEKLDKLITSASVLFTAALTFAAVIPCGRPASAAQFGLPRTLDLRRILGDDSPPPRVVCMSLDGARLWIALESRSGLVRLDLEQRKVTHVPLAADIHPTALTFGEDRLWILDAGAREVIALAD